MGKSIVPGCRELAVSYSLKSMVFSNAYYTRYMHASMRLSCSNNQEHCPPAADLLTESKGNTCAVQACQCIAHQTVSNCSLNKCCRSPWSLPCTCANAMTPAVHGNVTDGKWGDMLIFSHHQRDAISLLGQLLEHLSWLCCPLTA